MISISRSDSIIALHVLCSFLSSWI